MIGRKDIPAVETVINQIHERDGSITPITILEEARTETSPLHKYFCWDDTKAAESYRRWQARQFVACTRVTYTSRKGEPMSVRAFVSVMKDGFSEETRCYMNITKVMSKASLRQQLLDKAMSEVEEWRERYQHLSELAVIFQAIEATSQVTRPSSPAEPSPRPPRSPAKYSKPLPRQPAP